MLAPADILRCEWKSLAAFEAHVPEWRDLAARALEPNVFYEPDFLLASLPAFGRSAGAILVRTPDGRLVGFFPARIVRRFNPLARTFAGYMHPYAPLGIPLIDRECAGQVIDAWLDHLAYDHSLPALALLPLVPEGAFADALQSVIERRGLRCTHLSRHRRALLAPGVPRADYVDGVISSNLRRELGRRRRRLARRGALFYDRLTGPRAVERAFAVFLWLEAKGWKGRAGTAAARNPVLRTFLESAVSALARNGQVEAHVLRFGEKPIAAAILLRSGTTAWGWKIAYDEDYRRSSPGMQLLLETTCALLADPTITRADSCASADSTIADRIWCERLTLSDRLIALPRAGTLSFAAARLIENGIVLLRRAARLLRRRRH